ncbi:MAG TPA: aspartate/glutamate racemase family protein [Bacillota bacterium]|jgi:allantoin racemase
MIAESGPRRRRIMVINPVGTDFWDDSDGAYFRRQARAGTVIDVVSLEGGPSSLEGAYYETLAIPRVLRRVLEGAPDCDGMLVNCFLDPGVIAAREAVDLPIGGPGESAMLLACLLGHSFAVLTVKRSLAGRHYTQARVLGLQDRLASVIELGIPVLDLLSKPERTVEVAVRQARLARDRDGAEVIVLGCTGMATLAESIQKELDVPVVEPAAAALKFVETAIDLGLSHSRAALYRRPETAKISGYALSGRWEAE